MINYLITGGAGFIGANLVRKLVTQRLGNIFLIIEKNSDLWRLTDIMQNLTIFEANLLNFNYINDIIKLVHPDVIFHLASYGGLPSQVDQQKIFDINFYGTINLLNACKKVGFDCFVNTGSSSEYGIKNVEMRENDALLPISDYGVAKSAATQFCTKEATFNKLPVYTIRPFSAYGDYEISSRLIPTIMIGALKKNQINLSSEHFVRDFIYVQDVIDIYLKIAQVKPELHFVFNAGTGIQSSIADVVHTVESIMHTKLNISWNSAVSRPWEPKSWRANIDQAITFLGWQPKYSLKAGLQKTLKWFEHNINFYT